MLRIEVVSANIGMMDIYFPREEFDVVWLDALSAL